MRGTVQSAVSPSPSGVQARCIWTVNEKRGDIWVPVRQRKNVLTDDGLTALASAFSGTYLPPANLVIYNHAQVLSSTYGIGATSVSLAARVDIAGDTQLVLSAGLSNQETITFNAVAGSGPYVYTLDTPTTQPHNAGDAVTRPPLQSDSMITTPGEIAFDPVLEPISRIQTTSGYSLAPGNWVLQFYLTATMAVSYISHVGMSDNSVLGQGVLHNHVLLGYDHSGGTFDVLVEASLTLSNS